MYKIHIQCYTTQYFSIYIYIFLRKQYFLIRCKFWQIHCYIIHQSWWVALGWISCNVVVWKCPISTFLLARGFSLPRFAFLGPLLLSLWPKKITRYRVHGPFDSFQPPHVVHVVDHLCKDYQTLNKKPRNWVKLIIIIDSSL